MKVEMKTMTITGGWKTKQKTLSGRSDIDCGARYFTFTGTAWRKRVAPVAMLLALIVAFGVSARAQEAQEMAIPLLYEVRGFQDGVFQDVRGADIDNARAWIGVLEGAPLRIDWFRPDNGYPVKQVPVPSRESACAEGKECPEAIPPESARAFGACRGGLVTAVGPMLYRLHDDGAASDTLRVDIGTDEKSPWALKILCDSRNRVWLLLGKPNRLFLVDAAGKTLVDIIPNTGKDRKKDRVSSVVDIAAARNGEILVADTAAGDVKRFSADGKYIGVAVSSDRSTFRGLSRPALVATDSRYNVWVYDAADRLLKVYDPVGFFKFWIPDASSDGFRYVQPVWMTIDRDDHLLILDRSSRTLRAFDAKAVF
jgi:hypothetical protein